jgi:hypothetical protein
MTTDRERLNLAIANLVNNGGYARANVSCCQTCSWYEVDQVVGVKDIPVFFWHDQSESAFGYDLEDENTRGDTLVAPLYLYWRGNKRAISAALTDAGLRIVVPKNESRAFEVLPKV